MKADALPILYSFRRCPYAMRARMALLTSGTTCEIREVLLRDKPVSMIEASAKATVPVLLLPDGEVVDESLDIMLWALHRQDPQGWLGPETGDLEAMLALIGETETPFKTHLDRYKYSIRYDDADPEHERAQGLEFLCKLETHLTDSAQLFGNRASLADYAIFPFVRQFANTDRAWFDAQPLPRLQVWLDRHVSSDIFAGIMQKRPFWQPGDAPVLFA